MSEFVELFKDNLPTISIFFFECKKCSNKWAGTLGQCSCGSLKFRILSEQDVMMYAMENLRLNQMFDQAVFGLLLEENKKDK